MHFIADQLAADQITENQVDLPIEITPLKTTAVGDRAEVEKSLLIGDRRLGLLRPLLHEPLFHFLLAGIVLFAAASLCERFSSSYASKSRIEVSTAEIQRLRDVWTRQWGRAPNSKEMQNLIDEHVHEEILYREAIASGLDKEDTIIRRRLVEKLEFLSQEFASAPPSEQDLESYFQANQEKFRIPAEVAFSHLYFSTTKRGSNAESDANQVLAGFSSKKISSSKLASLGDPFMLQNEYPLQTEQEIQELFGAEFATKVFQLERGAWAGPLRSGYGFHLVFIQQKLPSRIPELAEVRNKVSTEFKNYRLQKASDDFYAQLRRKYQVQVDKSALAATESQKVQRPSDSETEREAAPDVD